MADIMVRCVIELRVHVANPATLPTVASNRRNALEDYIKRHWPEIEQIGSYLDEVSYRIENETT